MTATIEQLRKALHYHKKMVRRNSKDIKFHTHHQQMVEIINSRIKELQNETI